MSEILASEFTATTQKERSKSIVPTGESRNTPKRLIVALARQALRARNTFRAVTLDTSSPLAAIDSLHGVKGLWKMEGYMRPTQAEFFRDLIVQRPHIKQIAEVGFNGGHSAHVFLASSYHTTVTSFDLGEHDYVAKAKDYIDATFPNRHQLIIGDSKQSIAACDGPENGYDLVFIDGGHDFETAQSDIENMRRLAKRGATVVVDDYMPWQNFGVGPARAWDEAVSQGAILQEAILSGDNRTWAIGRYI